MQRDDRGQYFQETAKSNVNKIGKRKRRGGGEDEDEEEEEEEEEEMARSTLISKKNWHGMGKCNTKSENSRTPRIVPFPFAVRFHGLFKSVLFLFLFSARKLLE